MWQFSSPHELKKYSANWKNRVLCFGVILANIAAGIAIIIACVVHKQLVSILTVCLLIIRFQFLFSAYTYNIN